MSEKKKVRELKYSLSFQQFYNFEILLDKDVSG